MRSLPSREKTTNFVKSGDSYAIHNALDQIASLVLVVAEKDLIAILA